VSEDVFFCKKARDKGFKVWVDTTIICDHKGSTFFKVDNGGIIPSDPVNIITNNRKETKDLGVTVMPDDYRKAKVFK